MDAFLGEIRMFAGTFAPSGWAFCNGALYPIASYPALYSLLGTIYGGDGYTTFAVPDLRGRVPIHRGTGSGLSPRAAGQKSGTETVTLASANVPTHSHTLTATQNLASSGQPTGNLLAKTTGLPIYTFASPVAALDSGALSASGGPAQAHNNMQPYLCVNFIICMLDGIYPSRS